MSPSRVGVVFLVAIALAIGTVDAFKLAHLRHDGAPEASSLVDSLASYVGRHGQNLEISTPASLHHIDASSPNFARSLVRSVDGLLVDLRGNTGAALARGGLKRLVNMARVAGLPVFAHGKSESDTHVFGFNLAAPLMAVLGGKTDRVTHIHAASIDSPAAAAELAARGVSRQRPTVAGAKATPKGARTLVVSMLQTQSAASGDIWPAEIQPSLGRVIGVEAQPVDSNIRGNRVHQVQFDKELEDPDRVGAETEFCTQVKYDKYDCDVMYPIADYPHRNRFCKWINRSMVLPDLFSKHNNKQTPNYFLDVMYTINVGADKVITIESDGRGAVVIQGVDGSDTDSSQAPMVGKSFLFCDKGTISADEFVRGFAPSTPYWHYQLANSKAGGDYHTDANAYRIMKLNGRWLLSTGLFVDYAELSITSSNKYAVRSMQPAVKSNTITMTRSIRVGASAGLEPGVHVGYQSGTSVSQNEMQVEVQNLQDGVKWQYSLDKVKVAGSDANFKDYTSTTSDDVNSLLKSGFRSYGFHELPNPAKTGLPMITSSTWVNTNVDGADEEKKNVAAFTLESAMVAVDLINIYTWTSNFYTEYRCPLKAKYAIEVATADDEVNDEAPEEIIPEPMPKAGRRTSFTFSKVAHPAVSRSREEEEVPQAWITPDPEDEEDPNSSMYDLPGFDTKN